MQEEKDKEAFRKDREKAVEEATKKLLLKAQAGDASAQAELFKIYSRLVKTVAFPYYFASDSLDGEDVVQTGMIGLLNAIRTFDPEGGAKFETYASRCIKNAIIDEIRRSPEPTLPIDPGTEAPPDPKPIDFVEVCPSLSSDEIKVLQRRMEGMSYAEIAEELGVKKKKVDNLISSAKRKLKAELFG